MFDYSPEHCSHDGVKNLNRIIAFVVDFDVCLIDRLLVFRHLRALESI